MRDSIRTRKGTLMLGLASVLTLLGSASCGGSPTGVDEPEQICYLIDGQVYCYPSSGIQRSLVRPTLAVPENAAHRANTTR